MCVCVCVCVFQQITNMGSPFTEKTYAKDRKHTGVLPNNNDNNNLSDAPIVWGVTGDDLSRDDHRISEQVAETIRPETIA